jgi:hypothetical protein
MAAVFVYGTGCISGSADVAASREVHLALLALITAKLAERRAA